MTVMREQHSIKSNEALGTQPSEIIRVGRLNVHLLPLDHVDGISAIPPVLQSYKDLQGTTPGVVPLIEYFPLEIEAATGYKPPADGKPINPHDEFANINAVYGGFINQTRADRILVADPAFNRGFWLPEGLPMIGGMTLSIIGGRILLKEVYRTETETISRRQVIKRGGVLLLGGTALLSGLSTFVNQQLETQTGFMQGYNPPDLPGAIISETDFRILAITRALEQLGQATQEIDIRNIALVYPPAHIERIQEVFQAGGVAKQLGNLKFDFYKAIYNWQDILRIREWHSNGSTWTRTLNLPINFTI